MSITPKEIELVKSTWELTKKDTCNNGVELFMIIFKHKPEYKNMFSFKDVPIEELRKNKKFQAHTINVMYNLSALIDNLDSELLPFLLEKNIATHKARKVPPEAFELAIVAILELLQNKLPDEFTKEAENAWKHVLEISFKSVISALASA